MLNEVADGVWVRQSEWVWSNAIVVRGEGGLILVDPGIDGSDLNQLADDVDRLGIPVVAGFSTHPHWDHLLWHPGLGSAPRHATARGEETARARLSAPDWKARVAGLIPPEIADRVPLDLLRGITGLPAGASGIPWDGPQARIVEHQAHAPGHAALVIEECAVLVAGDMLSDVLVPMLDSNAADPIGDHLAALRLLEEAADDVDLLIPGHGSIAEGGGVQERIDRDRAYVQALAEGRPIDDPRIGPSAAFDWVARVHERQLQTLSGRGSDDGRPG